MTIYALYPHEGDMTNPIGIFDELLELFEALVQHSHDCDLFDSDRQTTPIFPIFVISEDNMNTINTDLISELEHDAIHIQLKLELQEEASDDEVGCTSFEYMARNVRSMDDDWTSLDALAAIIEEN
jgi:hypothetical protein